MLCVHLQHYLQSLARKIQKGSQCFLASFLATYFLSLTLRRKLAKATPVQTVSTTENNCLFCLVICHHFVGIFSSYLMMVWS